MHALRGALYGSYFISQHFKHFFPFPPPGSTYENEVRKISVKKKTDDRLGSRQRSGSENQGYVPEEPPYTGQIPTVVSLPPMSTKFTVPRPDLHTSSASKGRPQRHTDYPINPKKIRNVTHV